MARLSAAERALVLAASAVVGAACARAPKEGPPPAETLEIASAAPRALGALAAGTEGAPTGWRAPSGQDPDVAPEDPDDEEDGGSPPGRDAASVSPEDLPL
jgi:hypothetical protein